MSSKSGAPIRLQNLTKSYGQGDLLAVDDVSLDVQPGEFMTFLGPSGSGKTTTLNMIAGFVEVTSGSIYIDGQDIVGLPPHRRNIGVVFQQYALFPHMTAAENVAFPLERRKVEKTEISRRVAEALDMVRLGALGARYPKELSGGQQQRVAVARSIVFGPRVLLLDEPLGALDKKLREQLQGEIARLHRDLGITIIFVTHDQEEALALSDRIAVFNNGKVEQVGTAAELYDHPRSLFVAEFLGDSTIIDGVLGGDGRVRRPDGTSIPACSKDGIASGSECAIVVRPERIRVLEDENLASTDNLGVVGATVSDVVYLGSHRKVLLDLDGGGRAVVKETAGSWSQAVPGQDIRVSWAADNSVLVSR
ncbi:ABC transporter ATP-binding protein [Georgenia yuyongxinii]|uniref:Spermidine/putrescine import ATP-binding protein PotA n=1 Tax=Georgenia yuyongxinii TaxID=2589797 RepID=A0A5B8C6D2_9MICO|nr:ABC transporter ATP-binding protein [Georgenia yuyongxinii]QDC25680.1 ABC transporter ATP-binding protein [Georgenia yuyongxinii]